MAKAIMIQGTMSGAGKSLLTAGLCRIFKQDGYRVAPFKSQNMALNSFITEEGLEMGRAQVMQAEACGIAPSVFMNPVLLKPTNDTGSQVIVNGEVLGNYSAREYFAFKNNLIPEIMRSYRALDEEYDIIVLEGAGSPAEINLKKDDIVNMGMAKLAGAPVLLAGDIDRGGVFAQLYGTTALLEKDEREMVKGLIINKFRGDRTILDPGVEMLEKLTGIPVVGVTPYLKVDLEDEDSLSGRFEKKVYLPGKDVKPESDGTGRADRRVEEPGEYVRFLGSADARAVPLLDIAAIRLPRISNFTDFNPFEYMEAVSFRYVDSASKLGEPDLIILPGSKNTMGDLKWMRESGMEAALLKAHAAGSAVFGICGGYQMLGQVLEDPLGIENGGQMRGIGLLPVSTVFTAEKTRSRVSGVFCSAEGIFHTLEGKSFEGYEIHMGKTRRYGGDDLIRILKSRGNHMGEAVSGKAGRAAAATTAAGAAEAKAEAAEAKAEAAATGGAAAGAAEVKAEAAAAGAGAAAASVSDFESKTVPAYDSGCISGDVCGTYVHGIFDLAQVREGLIAALQKKRGIRPSESVSVDYGTYKEMQYEKLAQGLRANLDMNRIYEILWKGIM